MLPEIIDTDVVLQFLKNQDNLLNKLRDHNEIYNSNRDKKQNNPNED